MTIAEHIRKQIAEDPPEGWKRSGATHCTHIETGACVWHSPGIGWWAAPRDNIGKAYEQWELRGGFNTRADAMTAALELHATGGRYVDE